jgi:hypothetical protein
MRTRRNQCSRPVCEDEFDERLKVCIRSWLFKNGMDTEIVRGLDEAWRSRACQHDNGNNLAFGVGAKPAQQIGSAKSISAMIRNDQFWERKHDPIGKSRRADQVVSCLSAGRYISNLKWQRCAGQRALEENRVVFRVFDEEDDRLFSHASTWCV